jgi:uncharacterized protein (TIGR03437 family)
MRKYCALFSLCAGLGFGADFVTGQAARLVIGQPTFTTQQSGTSGTLLGAVGGLAFANGALFVADSNRVGLLPDNNRVLVFNNIQQSLPGPTDEISVTSRCPVCGGQASLVLGQPDFISSAYATTAGGMRLPCGVASDGTILAVADTDNNRVLLWKSIPTVTGQPADIVLGQKDFTTVGPVVVDNKSFRAPQGVSVQNGKLFVADTQNNRVMIWNSIPAQNNQPADLVLGQPNFNTTPQPDITKQTFTAAANSLLSPTSVTSDGTRLYVADLGDNRVLIWNSIPTGNQQPADVEIGQVDLTGTIANDSAHLCPQSGTDSSGNATYPGRCGATLNFPRFALSDGTRLFIADGGNDRVLVFNSIPTQNAARADVVLGENDEYSSEVTSTTGVFTPNLKQSAADVTPTPTSLAWDGTNLYVADPSNYRVLAFTPGTPNIPLNGIVNAASREIFALGSVTLGGTITANDAVTVTVGGTDYKYTIQAKDTFDIILQALADLINSANGGAGDPNVLARPELGLLILDLVARAGGDAGNSVTLATSISTNATITATASGATLSGGQNAATIGPGTIVSILGDSLADTTASADPTQQLPSVLGNVEVFCDGAPIPLLFVSPAQINAQVPFYVLDSNSISCYVRVQHSDGSVTVTTAIGVPIAQQNPGIFAAAGEDPRPAMAVHYSSYATGVISVDGTATAKDTATATVSGRTYTYTVQSGDTLAIIEQALIDSINADSESLVVASAAPAFTRILLRAKVPGPEGSGITIAGSSSSGATVTVSATSPTLCCANVAGAPLTPDNPAVAGETIAIYAAGLGIVIPDAARLAIVDGAPYTGPEVNTASTSVSSQVGGKTANVISAGLKVGAIGVYEVVLQLNSGLSTNPQTQATISQDIYTSNIVTIPVYNPAQ